MTIFGSRAGIRRIALTSCASSWGKAGIGLSQLVFAAPELWIVVGCGALGAALAASIAILVLRAAPDKAMVMAVLGIPLPAVLDVPLRRWLLGSILSLMICRNCLRRLAH